MTATIDGQLYVSASSRSLQIITSAVRLGVGTVDGAVMIRLAISDSQLCAQQPKIELTLPLSDRVAERARVSFVPAKVTQTVLDADGRLDAASLIRKTFRPSLEYILGSDQQWHSDYMKLARTEKSPGYEGVTGGAFGTFGAKFCNGCSWVMQQRLAHGLAKFYDRHPELIGADQLSGQILRLTILDSEQIAEMDERNTCRNKDEDRYYRDPWDWYTYYRTFAEGSIKDQALKLSPNGVPGSYLVLRSRRSMAPHQLELEGVTVLGSEVGGICQ